jgi:HTH-type transcriptional regulator/antitoxin HipB
MKTLVRDARQLGNLIRRARKQQALSQRDLGDRAGLRQETVSLLETGNAAAKLETVLSVLAALNLELQVVPRSQGGYLPD